MSEESNEHCGQPAPDPYGAEAGTREDSTPRYNISLCSENPAGSFC